MTVSRLKGKRQILTSIGRLIRGTQNHRAFCCESAAKPTGANASSRDKHTSSEQNDNKSARQRHDERCYDIVIVGGGMVGASMACALGSNPLFWNQSILVLEAAKELKTGFSANSRYSNRVSSITPGTRRMFENIGVWEYIEEMRYKPYSLIHVWDACGSGSITFDTEEIRNLDMGHDLAYIIENQVILTALHKQLKKLSDFIEIQYGKMISDISTSLTVSDAEHLKLQLSDGEQVKTKLLVAADGANSSVRSKLGMDFITKDYDQYGVVATLGLEKPSENRTAWQRFLPAGPIASLPLSETKSSLVWSTSPTHARGLLKLSDERFVDAVNNAYWEETTRHRIVDSSNRLMRDLIGALSPGLTAQTQLLAPPVFKKLYKGSRAAFPLGVGHATNYVKNRVALIGDAAHRVHPLAGQGVNLGFADAMTLCQILANAIEIGEDLGNLQPLLEYETIRQREVVPMIAAVDALEKLFSTDATPLVLARTLGLQATNALAPLKEQIMAFAMK